ncbi:MAG TPA: DUF6188 family protein [Candidatus Limnocylindrales bacterium]|nr:DUF6188 family protein [Candidatus Limnocylindrales bacterium]
MDMNLPIAGRKIERLGFARVVPYLTLDLPGWQVDEGVRESDFMLQIDGPYRFSKSGRDWTVDPEDGPEARCLEWLGESIASAVADDTGALRVEFVNGGLLEVDPFAYEPWHLSGADGWSVISVAGGGLAVTPEG